MILFARPGSQATGATCSYPFFTFWPTSDVLLVSKFCGANPFFIIFSNMDRVIFIKCDIFISIFFGGMLHDYLLINEL